MGLKNKNSFDCMSIGNKQIVWQNVNESKAIKSDQVNVQITKFCPRNPTLITVVIRQKFDCFPLLKNFV